MGLVALAKQVFKKKVIGAEAEQKLPMNASIGGILDVSRSEIAVLQHTLLKVPSASQQIIVGIGHLVMSGDDPMGLYRLYTNLGPDRKGEGASFVQLFGDESSVAEITLFQHLLRQVPTTEEDQLAFMGHGYGLGERQYDLSRESLMSAGFDAATCSELLAGHESLSFSRDTPGDEDYVSPYYAEEVRIDDSFGEKGMHTSMWFMPYARQLAGGQVEQLLIAFNVVDSQDGHPASRVFVDFFVGATMPSSKVKVI